ncbi:HEAT repeat domain-containing protein [Chryseobacterium contaminans]|uniref:HEAT repeat domain-containing protein n=1 Tax=Chryseobacterium contaminans TaxID=1423959 RepID=UPI00301B1EA8
MLLTTSVHFLFLVFLGMLSLVLVLIIIVLFYSFLQYREGMRVSGWIKIIDAKISEAIVYDEQELSSDIHFKKLADNSSFRKLFLNKLVDSEKKFSGSAKERIKDLFKQYGLYREAMHKLEQKKTYLIAGGIQELTVMDSKEAVPKIASFLSHSSEQVYQEAQYAMVSLKGFDGLGFLSTASGKISEWQQLRLLLSVTKIPDNSEAAIESWLKSNNASVIIFTLKLLRKFQLLSFYPMVISLMEHSSVEVRAEAVQTLLSLENPSTILQLIEMYSGQPIEVKLEILRVMKISKDKVCVGLLKEELENSPVSGIKVQAAEALFSLGQQEYLWQLIQDESSSEELIQIVKYALQEKVC